MKLIEEDDFKYISTKKSRDYSGQNSRRGINVIFRSQTNEDTKIFLNYYESLTIANVIEKLLNKLNITKNLSNVKLFFRGRPLKKEEKFFSLSINNNDVILYMIIEPILPDNDISKINVKSNINTINNRENNSLNPQNYEDNINDFNNHINSISNSVNSQNNNNINNNDAHIYYMNRGFNQFLNHGISREELNILRLLFHSAIYQRNLQRNMQTDFSPRAMIQREENWLNSEIRNISNRHSFSNFLRNNDFQIRRRIRNHHSNIEESNFCFIEGVFVGFILNLLTIFILLLCNFRRKFKIGLFAGMFISITLFTFNVPELIFKSTK